MCQVKFSLEEDNRCDERKHELAFPISTDWELRTICFKKMVIKLEINTFNWIRIWMITKRDKGYKFP